MKMGTARGRGGPGWAPGVAEAAAVVTGAVPPLHAAQAAGSAGGNGQWKCFPVPSPATWMPAEGEQAGGAAAAELNMFLLQPQQPTVRIHQAWTLTEFAVNMNMYERTRPWIAWLEPGT